MQVIAWLAHQPWSNGNVGMFGISWGGFTALQMAMRHAPELKAIIAVHATAELFHDDVHYMDGMAHVDEFELNMDMAPGMSGAPDYTLDEKTLGPRFDAPPWSLLYLKHQHDGPFWRDRVRPYSEITIPRFLIGGLQDGYRDNVTDMLKKSKAPMKAIVGPWNHSFPNDADFGPRIEWRDEAVRWWDHWLKGRDTGVEQDPRLVIYMQHWHPPDPNLQTFRENGGAKTYGRLPLRRTLPFLSRQSHTLTQPRPQTTSPTQIRSYDRSGSRILVGRIAERSASRGRLQPGLRFRAARELRSRFSDGLMHCCRHRRPHTQANWFARLSDVAPDGTVTQITGAGINGAQRESMTEPRDLEPGKVYSLDHRDAPDFVGLSQRPPHSSGDFERAVADDAAHAIFHDYISGTWWTAGIAAAAAGCSRDRGAGTAVFRAGTCGGTHRHQE